MKVFGITGWKNSGKTGLMERLIRELTGRGLRVAAVKHAHHSFDVDHPGKDSHRHRVAGASEVLLSSRNRWALMAELRQEDEPSLDQLLARLSPADIVLVEGYKRDAHPKIECWRETLGHELIAPDEPSVKALAGDARPAGLNVPFFDLSATAEIADYILGELGLGPAHLEASSAPNLIPPPLKNDCFVLPPGVEWTPVDAALTHLKGNMHTVTGAEIIAVPEALGRVLSEDVMAKRSNPPGANSAVDGYGFAHAAISTGAQKLPLIEGRAAAGAPYPHPVPNGHAIRILTGALLPPGVDTVVLEEDVNTSATHIAFGGPVKVRANTRKAGEDVSAGAVALTAGRVIRPPDLALMSALGNTDIAVRKRLHFGVLSTGDELATPGSTDDPGKTYDANRPMLLSLAERWGYVPVDLGHVADDRAALRRRLDEAAEQTDIVLTSGGASAGEEDHVSALLTEAGAMQLWRIAMKPGRPLAMGMWQGTPVLGLPGNPVAAFVCALIFARPAASVLAGAGWVEPRGFNLPAAFEKRKKAGRREYLRARINEDGRTEVFPSEGSGRISGLSWADGLVELEDGARHVKPGDPVRFLPYGSFGI